MQISLENLSMYKIKRYIKRPASLEHLTLADWAAWYDNTGKPYVKQSYELDNDNLLQETAIDDVNDDDNEPSEKKSSSKTKKRTKARIIRSVWFNKEAQPEKHYRELIMLCSAVFPAHIKGMSLHIIIHSRARHRRRHVRANVLFKRTSSSSTYCIRGPSQAAFYLHQLKLSQGFCASLLCSGRCGIFPLL